MVLMIARFANSDEIKNWNKLVQANPDGGNVFSSYEFAMQKETGGYTAHFLIVDKVAVTALEKNTPGLGKLWYLPKGPGIKSVDDLWPVLDAIKKIAKKNSVFAIRIESELDRNNQKVLEEHGLVRSRPIIPNPSTITLDVSKPLDTVMNELPQKGRYAIKRAEREGITVQQVTSTDKNCKTMYKLLSETARGQFGIRNYEYFHSFWQRFESAGYGQMFFASFDGKVVAAAYAMVYGKKSTYKDGASVRKRTVYGASHLLQWHVIEWAKSRCVTLHDFCGAPPSDQIDNPQHPHYGIGLFKTAFNKTVTDYIGCYDLIISPTKYKIWRQFGEKLAIRLHYYKHHDSYY